MVTMLSPMTRSGNAFRRGRRGARTSSTSAYFVTSPRVGREYIDLQLNAVRVTPPVSHMAVALIPTFGRLYGTLHAFLRDGSRRPAEGTWTYDRRSRADF